MRVFRAMPCEMIRKNRFPPSSVRRGGHILRVIRYATMLEPGEDPHLRLKTFGQAPHLRARHGCSRAAGRMAQLVGNSRAATAAQR